MGAKPGNFIQQINLFSQTVSPKLMKIFSIIFRLWAYTSATLFLALSFIPHLFKNIRLCQSGEVVRKQIILQEQIKPGMCEHSACTNCSEFRLMKIFMFSLPLVCCSNILFYIHHCLMADRMIDTQNHSLL